MRTAVRTTRDMRLRQIYLDLWDLGGRTNEVLVRVLDSGPGIPVTDRARIFEPGYSTKAAVIGAGSRGVGLSLVKRMVDRRGGSIRVGEAPDGGALFEVRLPLGALPAAPEPVARAAEPEAQR